MRGLGFQTVPRFPPQAAWLVIMAYSIAFVGIAAAVVSLGRYEAPSLSGHDAVFWRIGIGYGAWCVMVCASEVGRRIWARRRGLPFIARRDAAESSVRWIREQPWLSAFLRMALPIFLLIVFGLIPLSKGVQIWELGRQAWLFGAIALTLTIVIFSLVRIVMHRRDVTQIGQMHWAWLLVLGAAVIILVKLNLNN